MFGHPGERAGGVPMYLGKGPGPIPAHGEVHSTEIPRDQLEVFPESVE